MKMMRRTSRMSMSGVTLRCAESLLRIAILSAR